MNIDRRTFVHGSVALGALGSLPGAAIGAANESAEPLFNQPYVDIDEWRDQPFRHRYVHGGFKGTEAKLVIYFPPKEQYRGRFFQAITAVPVAEEQAANVFGGTNNFMGFCFDSGGAAVASNMGGFKATAAPGSGIDPGISTYRVSAATARYARVLAAEMYGPHRTYGYAFGGSGGGYRTLGCAQNSDAFDGVVPFMHPAPAAIPNGFAARIRGLRVLQDKFPQIVDALEPGGGDIYASLNNEQREVLIEVTRHGFPVRAWAFHETMGIGAFSILYQGIQAKDPTYFEEFWTTPGYLGADRPQVFADARIQHRTTVTRVIMSNEAVAAGAPTPGLMGRSASADPHVAWQNLENDYGGKPIPVALQLQSPPPPGKSLLGANINIVTGPSAGKALVLGSMAGNLAMLQFGPTTGSLRDVTDAIRDGHEVQIDNSNLLAFETYYRHALLGPDSYVCNQFRRADGTPMYPQRRILQNYDFVVAAVGSDLTGSFNGKMIVLQHLLDWDGHPWFADWYRNKVRGRLGSRFTDSYRLYYVDHATHGQTPDPTRTVPYTGALQQALRDLAAWVERGVTPPPETSYRIDDAQVIVPATAPQRKGIQPVVSLHANGGVRANVRVGQPVVFKALIEVPPGAGTIVAADWDFDATAAVVAGDVNRFPIAEQFSPAPRLTLTKHHIFTKAGTYFPALRVHSQRESNATAPYARVPNLGRVRIVVT